MLTEKSTRRRQVTTNPAMIGKVSGEVNRIITIKGRARLGLYNKKARVLPTTQKRPLARLLMQIERMNKVRIVSCPVISVSIKGKKVPKLRSVHSGRTLGMRGRS